MDENKKKIDGIEKEAAEEVKVDEASANQVKAEAPTKNAGAAASVAAENKEPEAVADKAAGTKLNDKKKILIIVISIIVVLAIAITVMLLLKKGKDNNNPTNQFICYATDENGIALTDDAGVAITYIADTTIVNQTTQVFEAVTNESGEAVTEKDGTPLTTSYYENVTDANGAVLTTVMYKDEDVTVYVPVTDESGENVTDTAGIVVTEPTVIPQNPNDAKPGEGVVMGTTVVPVTDGQGNSVVNSENGEVVTQIIPITSNPHQVEPASIDWKNSFGGTEQDFFSCVDSDKDGNIIAAVVTNSKNGDFAKYASLDVATPYSVITKYDTKGNVKWSVTAGSFAGSHAITDVVCTSDGGFYAIGYGRNIGGEIVTPNSFYDAFVYKYDKDGKEQWHKIFKTSTVDLFNAGALTSDGGIVVAGSVGNNDGDAAGFGNPANKSALCVVKYSSSGKLVWKNIFGGNQDSLKDICVTKNGNIFCVGTFMSGDLFTIVGKTDSGVVKLNSSGDYIGAVPIAGTSNDFFSGITACNDGGVAIVGRSNSKDSENPDSIFTGNLASRGGYDSYLIKLNDDLTTNFAKPFRGQYDDDLVDIVQLDDGSFVATGCSNSSQRDFKGITTRGGDDIVIAAFNMYGNLTWARSFGGTADEEATAICTSPKGGYVVAGSTLSKNIDMEGIAQYVNGKSVGVIVKFPE